MDAHRNFEIFATIINDNDDSLGIMSRCMNIGIGGGCGGHCAALWDGECKEAHEYFTIETLKKDLGKELREKDLKILYNHYPLLRKKSK